MLEKCTYTNHHGESIDFGKNGVYLMQSALHDYVWTVTSENKRICSIERDLRPFDLPARIICDSEEAGLVMRDRLHDVFEVDTVGKQPGKLTVGRYYISGYFIASTKTNYLSKKRMMEVTLSFQPADTAWHSERTVIINPLHGDTEYLDTPYDTEYDFTPSIAGTELINSSPFPVEFRMKIYGEANNPVILINGHRYELTCAIDEGETVTIDSKEKLIYKTDASGQQTNLFHTRNRESYIFEKLPAGSLTFTKSDWFPVELTMYEERSEPRWS